MSRVERPGVLLMTYGSPASSERTDVEAYLRRVRGGREPAADLVDEFARRYRVIGGSPLIDITRRQASALATELGWPVEAGMRFSEPSIDAAYRRLAEAGATTVAGIVLSPQHSPLLMGGYERALDEARAALGPGAPPATVAGAWHREPAFVAAVGGRIRTAIDGLTAAEKDSHRVLLTAHSLPRHVADREPDYLDQLRETAEAVASAAGLTADGWTFCWQSAGHEPGEWMKPDFADLMPEIAAAGGRAVVVAPVQFLAEHLEVLYDVDVGAREQAEEHGLAFRRIGSLNDDPGLIAALGEVARTTIAAGRAMTVPAAG